MNNRLFIDRPIFAISLAVATVLLGVVSLFRLSIEQYPDITPPVVEVTATYMGADAETVNNAVATPIAQSVMGVSDMLYMQTTSANDGSMTMQVTFDVGSNPDLNAIFTQNNVATATAQLPSSVVEQGVVTRKTQTGFLMVYALSSDGRYDQSFLSNYAMINMENELLKIDGVGKVAIMGAGEYAMRIWLRPDVLSYYNLSVSDVERAIAAEASLYPAGQIGATPAPQGTQYTYTVTLPPQYSSPEEFADIILRTTPSGDEIRLADVASVELGNRTYGTSSLFDSRPTSVMTIYQEPGSNAVEVGREIKRRIAELTERLPDGVSCTTIVDATTSITAGVREIIETLIVALLLVIAVIFLFIQDWRATIIPLVAIPVSLIGTFILFPILGFSINIVSLLGLVLAIGLVVDDAIVVVEAVQSNIERGLSPKEATVEAMRSVTSPIIATTIVLIAVFLPVSFSGGISGRLFQQFAVTIAVAVVFSMINALTLSPALAAKLLRPRVKPTTGLFGAFNRLFDRAMGRYDGITRRFVQRTKTAAMMVCLLIVGIVAALRLLPSGFLPEEDQGYFMVYVKMPDNTAMPVTEGVMQQVDRFCKREVSAIESSAVVAGFNVITGVADTSCGVIFVKMVDYDKRHISTIEASEQLTEQLYAAFPQAECYAFVQPAIPGLGVSQGITFELQDLAGRGTNYLADHGERLLARLNAEEQIASATTQLSRDVAQRRLDVDRRHALMSGVSLEELYDQTAAMLGGRYINSFNKFGRLYQTYLQAAPEYRADDKSLNDYYILDSSGASLPLSTFVTMRDTTGVAFVSQFDLYRSMGVTVTPKSGTSTSQAMAVIEKSASELLPDDIAVAWSGVSYQERSEGTKGVWIYLVALLFVLLTLSALYESWSLPMAIVSGLPLALMGALVFVGVAHFVSAKFINDIYMQISLVMLLGLAAKNSILVVEYADKLFRERRMSLLDATVEAAKLRVRPILMTALSFILGVMPLLFASGVYSTARNIMGLSLIGGMTFATLFGIVLYPALYYLVGRIAGFERKRNQQNS
ncbi:MAG: efflux RND transporter permease subunit [Alistipes sp.]|nr:efflux RND transporter permease subunit [Alistipes sp.]